MRRRAVFCPYIFVERDCQLSGGGFPSMENQLMARDRESSGSPVDRTSDTLAIGVDMLDGEIRHAAVDCSSAPNALARIYPGVSVLSALRILVGARMSM